MPNVQQFRLPDAGEGLTEAEIVTWRVRPGDTVRVNDPIVEIETAKSLVELPCPFAGLVTELLVAEGQTVDVGTPIIAVDTDPGGAVPVAAAPPEGTGVTPQATAVDRAPEEGFVEPGMIGGAAPGGRTAVLVGYGPRSTAVGRRPRIATRAAAVAPSAPVPPPAPAAPSVPVTPSVPELLPLVPPVPETARDLMPAVPAVSTVAHVLAKPPVRKLARDLGITLAEVAPSGPGGVITREDVETYRRTATATALPETAATPSAARLGPPDRRETRTPIKGVRKATAAAMVSSAFSAPHVTEWVQVDVTRTVKLLERLRTDRAFEGVRISPLLLVARALLVAVRRNPGVNATWDEKAQEIVVKHYVNLGIAAATPRGLVVPNVKDAHRLTLRELADALAALTATAREGRTQPAETAGGTVTITTVGVFGIDAGTPILNPGEAAILAVGQVRRMPWVHKGKVKPRWVTTLALSFDHRLVDGDLGSRTLADVAAVLEDPAKAMAWS